MSYSFTSDDDLIVDTLAQTKPFKTWSMQSIADLAASAEIRRYAKGEIVVQAGEKPGHVYVIATGALLNERVWANGKHILMGIMRPGVALKLAAVWDGLDLPHGLTARCASQVISIPRQEFLSIVRQDETRVHDVTTAICHQYRADLIRVNLSTVGSSRCQLAAFLCYYMVDTQMVLPEHPSSSKGDVIGVTDITQDELGAMMGCTRQQVNRVMKSMELDGVLERKGRSVSVSDYRLLLEVLEEDEPLNPAWKAIVEEWQQRLDAPVAYG